MTMTVWPREIRLSTFFPLPFRMTWSTIMHMTQAERVISKFGTIAALQQALGHKHQSTVQHWKNSGYIPGWRIKEVLQAARDTGVPLTIEDFFADFVDDGEGAA